MAGAATNPSPAVFAYAASQVKKAMEITKQLGGEGYVFWGGREGYETLLNTDMKRELDHLAAFLHMAVDYKKKIGFDGPVLHRAQAQGADQAPVRLRRRRRAMPSSQNTASRTTSSSTSRPTTPRWPATRSTTSWSSARRQRHPRLGRRQPRRPAARLGHRPVPDRPLRHHAGDATRSSRPAGSRPAA